MVFNFNRFFSGNIKFFSFFEKNLFSLNQETTSFNVYFYSFVNISFDKVIKFYFIWGPSSMSRDTQL